MYDLDEAKRARSGRTQTSVDRWRARPQIIVSFWMRRLRTLYAYRRPCTKRRSYIVLIVSSD